VRIRIAWAAIVVLATYLTFIGGGWLGIYDAPLRVLTMVAAAGMLVGWGWAAVRSARWRPRSALVPAIVAALASLAISTVFSRVPRVSLEYLGYAVVLAALYLLLVRLMAHPYFARRLTVIAATYFAVISVAFLALVVAHWVDWWRLIGHLAVPPLRPNFEGLTYFNPSAVLTMVALFAVPAAVLAGGHSKARVLVALIAIVAAAVAFLTGSRAGWLALALTIVVVVVAAALDGDRRAAVRGAVSSALRTRRARVIAFVAAAGMAVAVLAFAPAILRRVSEGGEDARAQYATSALRMFATSPVVGTGPGTWVIQRLATTEDGEPDVYIPHAHNIEVQTLAEQGVIGAAAGLVLVLAVGRLVFQGLRDPKPERRRFAWGAFAGLAYFAFHQFLDFYANMPAALFAAAIPLAYLDATAELRPFAETKPKAQRRPILTLGRGLAVAAVSIAVIGLLVQEAPASQAFEATQLADRGDWAAAAPLARVAADAEPAIGAYALTAGLAASRSGDHQAAAAYFERVADRDDLPEAWLDLAAEQLDLGNAADSTRSLAAALRLGRQRPGVAVGVADLAIRADAPQLASEALTAAIAANPTIAADPWWKADPVRRAALHDAAELLIAGGADQTPWAVALMVGEISRAQDLATAGTDPDSTRVIIDAWQGQPSAVSKLFDSCDAAALDTNALTWCARVAGHLGDRQQAERFRALLEVLGPALSVNAGQLRVQPPGEGSAADGRLAIFWGTFTYRRPTPRDMLVPAIAHLILE
jgi:O-antigen ligase